MIRKLLLLCLVCGATAVYAGTPDLIFEVEGGQVWQTVNDVQVPNDAAGTRFSLVDAAGKGPWSAGRAYLTWNLNERHGLRVLYAPLTISETGRLDGPVDFDGGAFAAGPVDASYRFNSYRLSYRYRFADGPRWTWWIGFSAKIRDAEIALEQGTVRAAKDDLGFVPLLHLAAEWRLADGWQVIFDADALAGGPGRAEDATLKLSRDLSDRVRLAAGYRLIEGGADVDSVYAFAFLHYAVASLRLAF